MLDNSKLIGIHFGCPRDNNIQYNFGTFIKYPFLNFLNNVLDQRVINSNIEKKEEDPSSPFYNISDIKFEKYYLTHLNSTSTENIYSTNVDFNLNLNAIEEVKTINELSGILKICLLKYIVKLIDNKSINRIKSNEIRKIISDLKKEIDSNISTNNPQENIKINLSKNKGKNIINYMKYIKNIIKEKDIIDLFGLFNLNMQNQIKWYWGQLSQYEYFDKKFQKDIIKAIENSYFDYSLICVSIYQQEKREKFIKDLNACDNKEVKYLFHGTQIDPISHIITKGFLYPRK